MTRRDFLKATVLGGAALLSGCGQNRRRNPKAVAFKGWAYEPDLVRQNIERFEKLSGIDVDYEAVAGGYHDKMVTMFIAKTPIDCCYVRDDNFAEWVEAGWLQPIQDLPGALSYKDDIFDFNLEAMSYDGMLYGLPYYSDFTIWVYNERLIEQAGFDKPGETLDEITEQAIKIKEKRLQGLVGSVIEYPLVFSFQQTPLAFNDWWALNYASEVDLFDDDLNPIFPDDPGHRAERILQWLVDGIHKHKIIDVASLAMSGDQVRENMASGRQVFCSISKYDLERLNNRKQSLVADEDLRQRGISEKEQIHSKVFKMAPKYPSLEAGQKGTLGWTRMYCLTSYCRYIEESWQLIQYLGGKDEDGRYYTAKWWFQQRGLGFCFKSLLSDPDIIRQMNKWGDIELIRKHLEFARARENIKAPWYPDFDSFCQAEIQRVLIKEQSPRDGLGRIADYCRKLKKEWA